MSQISSFTACSQRHKRIFVVGKCHEMSIYEQEGGPFLRRKQEEPIFAATYSPWTMTICTANREDVKVTRTCNTRTRAASRATGKAERAWSASRQQTRRSWSALVSSVCVLTRLCGFLISSFVIVRCSGVGWSDWQSVARLPRSG